MTGTIARRYESADEAAGRSSDRPIRVTHVVFDFDGGGLETLIANMAARFNGSKVQVSLVTLGGRMGRLGRETHDSFDDFKVIRPVPLASMIWPRAAARAIRDARSDVVHLHTGAWYKGAWAARLAGVRRVVYTEHGREHDDPAISRWIDRQAARLTDVVVTVSSRLASYMSHRVGVSCAKICTIHNGVDTSRFTPGAPSNEMRQALNIPDGALVIGSVGRLEHVKGYDVLLEAAAALRAGWATPFVLVLFGDGSQREALSAQAQRLGVSDIVRLPGWTTAGADAHRLFDLFVLSSRSEGQSVSLMEAMACGVVPVVTDVGANAEMLGAALDRHVVPAEDPHELADAIRCAAAPEAQQEVRTLVRRRAEEHYSQNRMTEAYERLYRGHVAL